MSDPMIGGIEMFDDDTRMTLKLTGVSTPFVNGIRREIISNVKTVAMVAEPVEKSTIQIIENSSRLNNQIIALRLSLIPVHILPSVPESLVTDTYEVRLSVTAKDGDVDVTTNDLKIFNKKTSSYEPPAVSRRVFPFDPPITIVPLRGPRGDTAPETITVTAGLSIGTGKDHACFSPTCCTTYSMSLDEEARGAALEAAVAKEGVKETDREAGFRAAFNTTTGLRYIKRNSEGDPVAFEFVVESIGQMNPLHIFQEGIRALKSRISTVRADIGALYKQTSYLTGDTTTIRSPRAELIVENTEPKDEYLIRFHNEEHTLGTILQDTVLRMAKKNDPPNYSKWFVGYRIPHPFTPLMVMRFHREGLDIDTLFKGYLFPSLDYLLSVCDKLLEYVPDVASAGLVAPEAGVGRAGTDSEPTAAAAAAASAAAT